MNGDQVVAIGLKDVSKKFDDKIILDSISLNIHKGDFICLYGKSGCGKTTLLNIIGTLENYNDGSVEIFNKLDPIKHPKASLKLRREKIAYLFQNFALVEKMTVEENLKLALKYNKVKNKKELIKEVLSEMGILDKLKAKVFKLSGGEQQRVALARNMLKPYEIMLADEPTGSLDEENKKVVIETLLNLNRQGKTIVIVTHDKDFLKVAKKVYLIENGKLISK